MAAAPLLFVGLAAGALWLAWSLFWVYLTKKSCDFLSSVDSSHLSDQDRRKFRAFLRADEHTWSRNQLLLGAFFLAPWRILFFIGIIAYNSFLFLALSEFVVPQMSKNSPPPNWAAWLTRMHGSVLSSTIWLFLMGVRIREYLVSEDGRIEPMPLTYRFRWSHLEHKREDGERQRDARRVHAPLVVSNHIAGFDVPYLMYRLWPAFVAKSEIETTPFVGTVAKILGTLFIHRETAEQKDDALTMISSRVAAMEGGEEWPPLIIFSEGQTSNGLGICNFKRGAFTRKVSVTPVVLHYPFETFSPSFELPSPGIYVPLIISQPYHTLEAYWMDSVGPQTKGGGGGGSAVGRSKETRTESPEKRTEGTTGRAGEPPSASKERGGGETAGEGGGDEIAAFAEHVRKKMNLLMARVNSRSQREELLATEWDGSVRLKKECLTTLRKKRG